MLAEKFSELEELRKQFSSQLTLLRVELLRELKLGQDNTLKDMNTALANLAPQLDGHESWLRGHESRLGDHDSRLNGHESWLNGHESWLNGHESRLGDHDSRLKAHDQLFDVRKSWIDAQAQQIQDFEERINSSLPDPVYDSGYLYECDHEQELMVHERMVQDHESRVAKLELAMRGVT